MLREEFMADYGLSVGDMARLTGVSRQTINDLVLERRSLSTDMALRLSSLFGNSPEFWLNLQMNIDLWEATNLRRCEYELIVPISV
jgi:addiction module HigA family antidote